jgi:hypothetical protein
MLEDSGTQSPPVGGRTCSSNPELVPDAGDDACLACVLERCCENGGVGVCLFDLAHCYPQDFADVRSCIEDKLTESSELEPWWTAAECVEEFDRPYTQETEVVDDARSPFARAGRAGKILECALGTRPQGARDDGGAAEDDGGLSDGGSLDAGAWINVDGFSEPQCAKECITGWP